MLLIYSVIIALGNNETLKFGTKKGELNFINSPYKIGDRTVLNYVKINSSVPLEGG